jgi:alkanesulfonate monooxygenase SsuD/methylene tetrahydromethanopterin reductase-like flavin-dependent oxidoreductase (luciferase family)
MSVRIGLTIAPFPFSSARAFRRWVELCEEQRIDSIWQTDRLVSSDPFLEPMSVMALLAGATERLKFGMNVAVLGLREPLVLAKQCATIDFMSEGRLLPAFGVGADTAPEWPAVGLPRAGRGARADEALEIMARLWAGESVTFEGKYYQIKEAFLSPPAPRGRVSLLIGGFVAKAMDRVVKYGDGYFGNIEAGPLYVEKLKAAGKDPATANMRLPELFTVVTDDKERAWEEIAPHFHHVNNTYGEMAAEDQALGVSENRSLEAMSLADFKASGIMRVLSPVEAIDLFRGMQERAPVNHIMLGVPPGLPGEMFRPYAELFAREVIPAFA